jgi:hypothetical protein
MGYGAVIDALLSHLFIDPDVGGVDCGDCCGTSTPAGGP